MPKSFLSKGEKSFRNLIGEHLFRLDNQDEIFKSFKESDHKKIITFNRILKNLNFEKKIKFLMKLGNMPSLVACAINKDEIVWEKAYGKSNIEKNRKATLDTVYMLASISKTITATAIMQLVEKNELELKNTDVSNYLGFELRNPKYPNKKITLKMLLAHRASLLSNSSVRWFLYFSLLGYPHEYFKEYLLPGGSCYQSDVWAQYEPGKKASYSSEGIDIAAYAIEQITGLTFEDYCKENIFERLDSSNATGFHLSDFKIDDLAVPYLYSRSGYIALPHYDIGIPGSGGARSTINDLSRYLILHMNGGVYNGVRVLSKKSVEEMHKAQYPYTSDDGFYFGLGWYTIIRDDGKKYGGHDGTLPGFRLVMRMCEEDKTGVIFFYNRYHYFPFREKYRPIGWLEEWSREQIEQLLFEKAKDF